MQWESLDASQKGGAVFVITAPGPGTTGRPRLASTCQKQKLSAQGIILPTAESVPLGKPEFKCPPGSGQGCKLFFEQHQGVVPDPSRYYSARPATWGSPLRLWRQVKPAVDTCGIQTNATNAS